MTHLIMRTLLSFAHAEQPVTDTADRGLDSDSIPARRIGTEYLTNSVNFVVSN